MTCSLNSTATLQSNTRPVPPFRVPQFISLAFWGGVWGIVFVLVERAVARSPGGYWVGARAHSFKMGVTVPDNRNVVNAIWNASTANGPATMMVLGVDSKYASWHLVYSCTLTAPPPSAPSQEPYRWETVAVWGRNLFNEQYVYRRDPSNSLPAAPTTSVTAGNINNVLGDYGNFNAPRTFGVEATVNF